MGVRPSRPSDDTTGDDGPAQWQAVTNATSPEAKISMARPTPLPTGNDMTQFESSGRAPGWAETMPLQPLATPRPTRHSTYRPRPHTVVGGFNPSEIPEVPPLPSSARSPRGSTSAQLTEAPRSQSSAPSPRASATAQPDEGLKSHRPSSSVKRSPNSHIGFVELKSLSPASGKLSKSVKALDLTSKLTEKTKPKFTGLFSDVLQAKLGDRVVAVKTLRVPNIEGSESPIWKRLAKEIDVWATLDHPNVLELLGYAFEDGKPCLISPWCDNGTLQHYLQRFPDANRRRLVREIAEGLRYLHMQTPPIIHGDLKTTNVLVTGDYVAKISDFGGSRRVELLRTGFTTDNLVLATIRYSAPEILRDGQDPTLPSDVFSLACVALETMTDKCPFWKTPKVVEIIGHVVLKKQTPSPEDHPGMEDALWELLQICWNYEPLDRPHMVDVCRTLAGAGCGPPTDSCPPTRARPPSLSTRFDRSGRGTTTV